jgi:hypothetical protein
VALEGLRKDVGGEQRARYEGLVLERGSCSDICRTLASGCSGGVQRTLATMLVKKFGIEKEGLETRFIGSSSVFEAADVHHELNAFMKQTMDESIKLMRSNRLSDPKAQITIASMVMKHGTSEQVGQIPNISDEALFFIGQV